MNIFLSQLLAWLQTYGYLAIWLTLCVAALGLPLPIDLVLLAAGAFSALGDFNPIVLVLVAAGGSICGDTLGYGIGRWWGHQFLNWLERPSRRRFLSPRLVAQARTAFVRRGGWAIFLSRFLLSSLGGEINLLAGANPFPYRRFLLADASGELLGAIIPLSLGYWFGASWEAAGDLLDSLSLLLLGACTALFLAWMLTRTRRHPARQREGAPVDQPVDHASQAQREQNNLSNKPHQRQEPPRALSLSNTDPTRHRPRERAGSCSL